MSKTVSIDRAARAERLSDYFELQLRFAEHIAMRTGMAMPEAVLRLTNLHRRFGFGDPDRQIAPDWHLYARQLATLTNTTARLAWTKEFFLTAPEDALPSDQYFFGCFGCEAPDARAVVRIHFTKADRDGVSPLHRSKVERRRTDLTHLVRFIGERFPNASSIKGISWLYHLEAYRRLFPPLYAASAASIEPVRLNGAATWGQFLRHDDRIKPQLRDQFLQSFATMDMAAPWRSLPLPPLMAQAPLTVFTDFYLEGRPGIHD